MIEMIIGRAGVGKTYECMQRAKKLLKNPLEHEIIFLLPAYQTNRMELELASMQTNRIDLDLAEMTGGTVNTYMESFNRFSKHILNEVGGSFIPRLSEIGRRLLLKKILLRHDKAGDLEFFVKAAKQHGFAEVLSGEMKELKTYEIDAEKLKEVAAKIDDDDLRRKLNDLAILSEDFHDIMADKLTDEENLLTMATELLEQYTNIERTEIFIDGFIFFDPQQRKFLSKLCKYAANVHITLTMDTNFNSRENTEKVGTFYRSAETFHMLKNMAADIGVDFKVTKLNTLRRFKNDSLKILEQRLFDYAPKKFAEAEGIYITEAVNRRAEVEDIALKILNLVNDGGYNLRDIGILARDENYFAMVKPFFEIHKIPFFVDIKRPAANHPLAELIRSALEVLRGWRRESVFRCLRTGFFSATADEIDLLENYVMEFGLKGATTWQESWHYLREKSLEEKEKIPEVSDLEYLKNINEIRRTVSEPLMKFAERMRESKNDVTAMSAAVFKMLEELKVYEKLLDRSQTEEIRGNLAMAREHLKIWDDIVNLLEETVHALGDEETKSRDFEIIINEGLDALKMSLIPPSVNEVTVAQFDQNSLQNTKVLFVLGFDSNNFPRRVQEKILLSDADRMRLNDAEVEISDGGKENVLAEKFLIYRGLTSAAERLYLSYPIADANGAKISASALLNKIREIFPVETQRAELDILQSLGGKIFTGGDKKISPETAKRLFAPNNKIRASVTRFEEFNTCPFKFFAQYGLDLDERIEYKIETPDIGNILHAVMSKFGKQLKAEGRQWSSIDNADMQSRVDKILNDLTPRLHNKILLSTKTLEHRRERIRRVAVESLSRLIELDKVSQFHPQIFETGFNEEGSTRTIGDVDIELTGQIDRIDLSNDGKKFLIIDYKTGETTLSLRKIYGGLSLQLVIYLSVANRLAEMKDSEGVAMLYCLLKLSTKGGRNDEDAIAEGEKDLKMLGLIRMDDEIKTALDGTEKFISLGKNNLLACADFKVVIDYAEKILQTTAERIVNGCIEVKPAKYSSEDVCEYCLYSALCSFDRSINDVNRPPYELARVGNAKIIEAMRKVLGMES
ncbi:MAG: PD-(D/E)XK nuclease family protein [Selenomonadaceae bacterium]|nr:PD-(D/E)XK nuclease family protein [Selenomonadaceae bacterium]